MRRMSFIGQVPEKVNGNIFFKIDDLFISLAQHPCNVNLFSTADI